MTIAELLAKYADHPLMKVEAEDLVEFSVDSFGDAKCQVEPNAIGKYGSNFKVQSINGYTHWTANINGVQLAACKANPPATVEIPAHG